MTVRPRQSMTRSPGRGLERLASPDELEAAEADAVMEAHREWVAAGRPGAVSHEEAMAELLGDNL
jgi:hypothetical protein